VEGISLLLLFRGRLGALTRHVVKDGKEAKLWLNDLNVAVNLGYSAREIGEIIRKARVHRVAFQEAWMTTLQIKVEDARPIAAVCDDAHLTVTLQDGRVLRSPLWWYPRLQNASPSQREVVELMPMGIHWPDIDEDISIASILRGAKAPGARAPVED
jgi:hypothetical protein